jgi:hypothetical protein
VCFWHIPEQAAVFPVPVYFHEGGFHFQQLRFPVSLSLVSKITAIFYKAVEDKIFLLSMFDNRQSPEKKKFKGTA